MLPTINTNMVAEGLSLLTGSMRPQAVVNGLLASYLASVQDLENNIWAVINAMQLGSATNTGVWLDYLGGLVGQPRGGLSDTDYLTVIKLRIRANASGGRAEDVIAIAALLANPNKANYVEQYPAGFLVEAWNVNGSFPSADLVHAAAPAGVYGVLHYSTWPAGNDFEWVSVNCLGYPSGTQYGGEGTWGTTTDPTVGGLLVAAVGV